MAKDGEIKRHPTTDRTINSVDIKKDVRVAIVGVIKGIDKENSICTFEDFTGETTLIIPYSYLFDQLESGGTYRIIGKVMPYDKGFEIKVEIVKRIDDIDMGLYKTYIQMQ